MNAYKMACIHYQSDMNDWMDCLIYVPESVTEKALNAVHKGVEMYNEEDGQQPYGECIEDALCNADIPYLIEYCEYDEDTDKPYQSWIYHVSEVEGCNSLMVITA